MGWIGVEACLLSYIIRPEKELTSGGHRFVMPGQVSHYEKSGKTIIRRDANDGGLLVYWCTNTNVFFKVYLDWARKPDDQTRARLLPHLHVPLDSIVMKTVKKQYLNWYNSEIKPLIDVPQQEFSLSKIGQDLYMRWLAFFRQQYPEKPLLFDIVWGINRR